MKLGSIVPTSTGFRAFYSHNGKRISKRCATEREATDWLAQCRSQANAGTLVEPSTLTLGEWVLEWFNTYAVNLKPNTLSSYKSKAKKLAPIANIRLSKLSPVHIQRLLNSIPTPARRWSTYLFLSTVLKRAIKVRLIPYDILAGVDSPKYQTERKDVFSDEEIAKIRAVLPKYKRGNLFLIMLATGCRLGEVLALKISNVFPDHIRIDSTATLWGVGSPKTEASKRDVSLPPSTIALIRSEWAKNKVVTEFVFGNKHGECLDECGIERTWHRILNAAGVPFRGTHYLRHTHATNLLHEFDYVEVQHRLGHSRASTTLDTYGHIKQEVNQAIISAVEKMVQ